MAKVNIYVPDEDMPLIEAWRDLINLSDLFRTAFREAVERDSRATVQIVCTYYKASGKWYAAGVGRFPKDLFVGCIYPKQFGRFLRRNGRLPGLESGMWDGPFTVSVDDGYTELCLPEEG